MKGLKEFLLKNKVSIIVLLIAIIFPNIVPLKTSTITLINLGGIFVIAAIGYNILLGYGGQISLGHAAFIGLGAYITANLSIRFNVHFIIALVISILVTAILGFILGLPALRLEGNYLAIATLGFGVAFEHVFMEFEKFTGGFSGLKGINPPKILGYAFKTRISMYYFILFFIVIAVIIAKNLINSKTGRALMALRDSEIAASSLGVNTAKYKTIAFVISAAYAGAAGSLFAYLYRQVYPQSFGMAVSLNLLAMIVIGGLSSISGSIIGAMFMTMLPEYIKAIPIKNGATIITGILLILTVRYCPYGINQIIQAIKGKLSMKSSKSNASIQGKEA
ncbi:branched-chain amino acid ABC transporter permease [Clostridium amazonitimonense]|uniref:branched-chain amino acid ABC transporter permease n=1 Tax=Clostridium amazonitimonense TaxID=1499689 RepID=UPI0005A94E62|nr:branched-chain amino acid ABC transporter permease [Clostridium amazonitimonense]